MSFLLLKHLLVALGLSAGFVLVTFYLNFTYCRWLYTHTHTNAYSFSHRYFYSNGRKQKWASLATHYHRPRLISILTSVCQFLMITLLSVIFKWSLSLSDNVKFLMMPVVYHFTFLLGYYYHIYCHNRISSLKYQRQFLWLVAQLDNSSNNDVSSLITSLSLSRIQRMISLYHVI